MESNPLKALGDLGQSVWCDDIGRDMLLEGRLRGLIENDGVVGVTSNPTIFHKAVTAGSAYDSEIEEMASNQASTEEIMESLMLRDIGMAADQLRPVHEKTGGLDGLVSIEVAPALAYDTMGTEAEVKRVRGLLPHPNILIKVPGTSDGVAAIHDLIGLGYSINVTLIFSLERYKEVMEAYLSGLELLTARRNSGDDLPEPAAVRSVASFFVSRVDSQVDKRLDALAAQAADLGREPEAYLGLKGKAAVANAKSAYGLFRETFTGPRWEALAAQGAHVQRPLWASTSTKNPAYSDVLYVEELIGPDTVNTMPLSTLEAYRDHGRPQERVSSGLAEAQAHLEELEEAGVDMGDVTDTLEQEGVKAFAESYEALLAALDEKRRTMAGPEGS